jgi:hypothetical protein
MATDRAEENLLRAHFGAAYESYRAHGAAGSGPLLTRRVRAPARPGNGAGGATPTG